MLTQKKEAASLVGGTWFPQTSVVLGAALLLITFTFSCSKDPPAGESKATAAAVETSASPDPTIPANGPKNVVHVALGSKDHTTLVTALKSADYVDSLMNPGPFTVFAPTNDAFNKLPAGTVDGLLKPDKKDDLKTVLKQHVAVSVYQLKDFKDGQTLGMANGGKVTFHVKDGKVTVNDANIVASIPASNGIVHVIDAVLLPK
jgi:uncharacterized surface protein with fasciclin (FAS1) repeats